MDWQVKPLSRKSSISGEVFEAGATVICHIFFQENIPGELIRKDILREEINNFELPNNLVAKWTRKVGEKESEEQKQLINNAEELFFSLYSDSNIEVQENIANKQDILKQLIGLMLERKRILKRVKTKDKGIILYVHSDTKKEYEVIVKTLELEEILKIQEQLQLLIY